MYSNARRYESLVSAAFRMSHLISHLYNHTEILTTKLYKFALNSVWTM